MLVAFASTLDQFLLKSLNFVRLKFDIRIVECAKVGQIRLTNLNNIKIQTQLWIQSDSFDRDPYSVDIMLFAVKTANGSGHRWSIPLSPFLCHSGGMPKIYANVTKESDAQQSVRHAHLFGSCYEGLIKTNVIGQQNLPIAKS